MDTKNMIKVCSRCNLKLPLECFRRDGSTDDGYTHRCSNCLEITKAKGGAMYITDKNAIINTQGLRWAIRIDKVPFQQNPMYLIEVQYKGSSRQIEYKDPAARDEMFDKLVAALTKSGPPPRTPPRTWGDPGRVRVTYPLSPSPTPLEQP